MRDTINYNDYSARRHDIHDYFERARKVDADCPAINKVAWFVKLAPYFSQRELYSAIPEAYEAAQSAGHAEISKCLEGAIRVTVCTHLNQKEKIFGG